MVYWKEWTITFTILVGRRQIHSSIQSPLRNPESHARWFIISNTLLCPSGSTLNIIDCITEPFVVSVHAEDGLVNALLETTIKQWITVFSKTKNSSLLLDSNGFGNKKIQSSSNDLKITSRHQMTLGGSSRDLDYSMCKISFLHWRMHNLSYIVQTDFLFSKC